MMFRSEPLTFSSSGIRLGEEYLSKVAAIDTDGGRG
jgi:hypothetical protein